MHKSKYKLIISAIAALVAELVYPALAGVAHAAPQFDVTIVRWDTHKALTDSGITVCIKPNANIVVPASTGTTGTAYHMKLTFPHMRTSGPTDFTFNSTTYATDWTLDTTFTNEGPITWNGTSYAMTPFPSTPAPFNKADGGTAPVANTSGGIINIPVGSAAGFTLSSTLLYCLHITGTNTLHNSDVGTAPDLIEGKVDMFDNAGSPVLLYETFYNTSIIADDQVVVSAIVPPNFTMSLSLNNLSFGRLNTLAINTTTGAAAVLDVVTNAAGGWIAWVKDTDRGAIGTEGLHSATANYTIKSGGEAGAGNGIGDGIPELLPVAGGVEGYLLDADFTDPGGTGVDCDGFDNTISPAHGSADGASPDYDADESTINAGADKYSGGNLVHIFQPLANCTGPAPATANHDQVAMKAVATISGATPAGTDYTDTWTIVAAGEF